MLEFGSFDLTGVLQCFWPSPRRGECSFQVGQPSFMIKINRSSPTTCPGDGTCNMANISQHADFSPSKVLLYQPVGHLTSLNEKGSKF